MDHLLGIVRLFVWFAAGLLLGGLPVLAFAETINATSGFRAQIYGAEYYDGDTAASACLAASGSSATAVSTACLGQRCIAPWTQTGGNCKGTAPPGTAYPGNVYGFASYAVHSVCPAGQGWTLVVNECTRPDCTAGQVRDSVTGQCVLDCGSKAGQTFDGAVTLNTLQQNYCWDGCRATLIAGVKGGSICSGGYGSSGVGLWWPCDSGTFRYTGAQCGGADPAPTPDPPAPQPEEVKPCPAGTCPGTFNGQTMCVACGSDSPRIDTQTSTKTNSDGSTSTTTSTTTSTSTTSSTSSTTTTAAPDGTPTGTTTNSDVKPNDKKNEMDDFCTLNPNLSICKESSFGGSCAAFTCDGDAIQCAMAREQHKRNCIMFDTVTPLSTLGEQVAAGNDPQASNFPNASGKVENVNLASALDTSNPFAGGCVQDKSFQIMTTTLVIPFSNICPYLENMGTIVLVFSMLGAVRIMLGGI